MLLLILFLSVAVFCHKIHLHDKNHFAALFETPIDILQSPYFKQLATFYGQVSFQDENYKVLFDTGSNSSWVRSKKCKSFLQVAQKRFNKSSFLQVNQKKPRKFFQSFFQNSHRLRLNTTLDSKDNTQLNEPFEIKYVGGKVKGHWTQGNLVLGDLKLFSTIGLSESFELPKPVWKEIPWGGIIGLGPDSNILKKSNNQKFSYYLGEKNANIDFNEDFHVPQDHWIPIIPNQNHWQVDLPKIFKNNEILSQNQKIIFDTGSFLIYGPYRQIKLNDCDLDKMPLLKFEITKDQVIYLEPKDYVLTMHEKSETQCIVGIVPEADLDQDSWTFGSIFFKRYTAFFDLKSKQISFKEREAKHEVKEGKQ